VPLRLHPRLIELGRAASDATATDLRGRDASAAYRARRARWPAIALGAVDDDGIVAHRRMPEDEPGTVDLAAMEAALELCLDLATALDADLAQRAHERQD
jgi:hypothetical protein